MASPGDLSEERRVAREVVKKVNRIVSSSIGWQIDLREGENALPGAGRPQELINKDIDSCDLFLGVLWRRWGSSTGEYSSGFEEEFERAKQRHQKNQHPTMWLCFKEVEIEQKKDPGEQLKKVLAFYDTQVSSKEFLFKEFKNSEDWRDKLDEWLLRHVLNFSQETSQDEQFEANIEISSPAISNFSAIPNQTPSEVDSDAATTQLINLVTHVSHSLSSPKESNPLNRFEIARLCLFSKTLLSNQYYDDFLSNHEIHLLYQYRDQLEPTIEEILQFTRTLIDDDNNLKVGWYWLQGLDVTTLLFYLAQANNDSDLRIQAIKILEEAKVCLTIEPNNRLKIRNAVLVDKSVPVRIAWLSYLSSLGRLEDLPIVKSACNDEDLLISSAAESARICILLRHNLNEAVVELVENNLPITKLIVETIKKQSDFLSNAIMLKALSSQNPEIRLLILKELIGKNILTERQIDDLINDDSVLIKKICYEALLKMGRNISLDEIKKALGEDLIFHVGNSPLLEAYYRMLPVEKLLEEIYSPSIYAANAYKALATDHFETVSDRIRLDLEDDFSNLEMQIISKLEIQFKEILSLNEGEQVNQINELIESFKKTFRKYSKYEFIKAALSGIVLHGNAQDIRWGRKYLEESDKFIDFKLEAIKIVEIYGDESDAIILVNIAKNSYGDLSDLAAKVAVKLSPGIDGAAFDLINSESSNLIRIAMQSFEDRNGDEGEVFRALEPFLKKGNFYMHDQILKYFFKKFSFQELEEFLAKYLLEGQYYYHIVCWLDRILYAPPRYKQMYLQKLTHKLN
ncbi:DUF4062 domain-containing protein [Nodosilinea sp. LEGE 07298]|uniref:DUF4062 domain-containing protein n=1 Tax=Nodosilinea sp. LEGE 07298 TaxID=2777970 RepID=UPI001882DAEF|nr:DUF4062 domain-containing protein [Nodosilinea sp. LEGE 07298]MBE9108823.1 DUF4062 domain-containing protein [Nodosilinea sp. LEGE 07298]